MSLIESVNPYTGQTRGKVTIDSILSKLKLRYPNHRRSKFGMDETSSSDESEGNKFGKKLRHRKGKSQAGEAMKLAHKKGISLKKAWSIVKSKE